MKRNKGFIHVSIYNGPINGSPSLLLRPYNLELARNVCEEVSVGLGDEFALVGLLYKVLIALLVGEVDGIFLALELDPVAVHKIGRRLPSHQLVLPPMALGEHIPVHQPM
jgi:hypothetical protein